MKIRFSSAARAQLLEAIRYIKADNPAAASRFRYRAERALKRLGRWPESGLRIPEFPDLVQFREIVLAPYRFFYKVVKDTVWVIAVWHGTQLPGEPRELRSGH